MNTNIATILGNWGKSLKIVTWNIANAQRDNTLAPLIERLNEIIGTLKDIQKNHNGIDVLVLLEANRSSTDKSGVIHSFTSIANKIQNETGLLYLGQDVLNPSGGMAFGKAVFYNGSTCFVNKGAQTWASSVSHFCSGPYFGCGMTNLTIWPLDENKKLIANKFLTYGGLHFPMVLDHRMEVVNYLRWMNPKPDLIMGDFNTFPDDGGPLMIQELTKAGFINCLPSDTVRTFHAFPHDTFMADAKKIEKMPHAIKMSEPNEQGLIKVRPISWLDQCMLFKNFDRSIECSAKVIEISTIDGEAPSDHFPILAECLIH